MSVSGLEKFIEPWLRFLARGQLTYKNRAGWAHDRFKRVGYRKACRGEKGA